MGKLEKLITQVLSGRSDSNIAFSDLQYLLLKLGFSVRIRGSHHIYTMQGIAEILNLQPNGAKAKPYQVKQIRNVILHYRLEVQNDE